MNKKPTTYADFEAAYFAMREEVMADNKDLNFSANQREWSKFSAQVQAGYAYAEHCMYMRKGSVTGEDGVQCFTQTFQAIIAHLYDELPTNVRDLVMDMIVATFTKFVASLKSGKEGGLVSKSFIEISSEGTGRA